MSKKEKDLTKNEQGKNADVENLDNLDALANEIGLITLDDDPDKDTASESLDEENELTVAEIENDRIIKGGGFLCINPSELHVGNNTVTKVKTKFFSKKKVYTQVKVKDVVFFDATGWFTKTLGFGYLNQIFIKGVKKEEREWLKQHLIKNGAKIGHTGETIYSPRYSHLIKDLFNVKKWIYRESFTVADEGVIFVQREYNGKKTTYLPFDKMKYIVTSKGIRHKEIKFFGEQNIIPDYAFKKSFIKKLFTTAKEKGARAIEGKTFKTSKFLSPQFAFNKDHLICGDNDVFYYSKKKKKSIFVVHYDDITNVWKKNRDASLPILRKSLFFKDIYIRVLPSNIRNNVKDPNAQAKMSITVCLRHVWWYKWKFLLFFSGKLRRIMKRHGVKTKRPSIFD